MSTVIYWILWDYGTAKKCSTLTLARLLCNSVEMEIIYGWCWWCNANEFCLVGNINFLISLSPVLIWTNFNTLPVPNNWLISELKKIFVHVFIWYESHNFTFKTTFNIWILTFYFSKHLIKKQLYSWN